MKWDRDKRRGINRVKKMRFGVIEIENKYCDGEFDLCDCGAKPVLDTRTRTSQLVIKHCSHHYHLDQG